MVGGAEWGGHCIVEASGALSRCTESLFAAAAATKEGWELSAAGYTSGNGMLA